MRLACGSALLSPVIVLLFVACDAFDAAPVPPATSNTQAASDNDSAPAPNGSGAPSESPAAKDYVPGRLLVKFKPGVSVEEEQRILDSARAQVVDEIGEVGIKIIELPAHADEEAQQQALGQNVNVEFAELDRLHQPSDVSPNDYWYFGQWYLPRIGAPLAWSTTTGSSNVIIAICDTGVDGSHPDLASKLVPGWNAYSYNADTSDATGHGTTVAGTAAAASNNSVGVASVAWGCKLMPIRVTSSTGSTSSSVIARGIVWAADHGARVVNVSFSVVGSALVTSAAQYLQNRGGVMTSVAGNDGLPLNLLDDPYVLTIGATDVNDVRAPFSNFGSFVDFCAPGAGIYSTARGGGYASGSGTSFAAPCVAGVAALVLSVNPSLSPTQVRNILKQSCDDLGTPGWDLTYSWGRINAGRAVGLAGGTTTPPPDSVPPVITLTAPGSGSTVSGIVGVSANATDNVGVTGVRFSVDGTLVAIDTAAPYTFAWNASGVSNGVHDLEVRATDAAGNSGARSATVYVNNPGDSSSPTVVIALPSYGTPVQGRVFVSAIASDNVGVSRVELFVDDAIKSVSTTPPFTTTWNCNGATLGTHFLRCKAYDAAGNVGQSPMVPVVVYK